MEGIYFTKGSTGTHEGRRVVHFRGCLPATLPFSKCRQRKFCVVAGSRNGFQNGCLTQRRDRKVGGSRKGREEGRPDINFAHARGKLVGTESRRMKLEPDTAAAAAAADDDDDDDDRGMKCRFAV